MALSTWQEEYRDHQVWATIDSCLSLLDAREPAEPNGKSYINRIRPTLESIKEWSERPSLLVGKRMTNRLDVAISENVLSNLNNWIHRENDQYLFAAYEGLDEVLEQTRGWPPTKDQYARAHKNELETLKQEILDQGDEYERTMDGLKVTQQQITEKFSAQLNEFRIEAQSLATDVARSADAVTDSFLVAQATMDEKLAVISAEINRMSLRIDSQISTYQEQFLLTEKRRENEFMASQDVRKSELDELVSANNELMRATTAELQGNAQQVLARLKELSEDAESVVGALATSTVANGYGDFAEKQRNAADKLRWGAIFGFLVTGAVAIGWLLESRNASLSISEALLRFLLTVSFGGLSAYLVAQSADHRREEFQAKMIELKLRTFDPFIATLDEDKRRELKGDTARSLFMHGLDGNGVDTHP